MKRSIADNRELSTSSSPERRERKAPDSPADVPLFSSAVSEKKITGLSLSRGLALGEAVIYEPFAGAFSPAGGDVGAEILRLRRAVDAMHDAINRLLHHGETPGTAETRDILEAYQIFARDRGWLIRIEDAIGKGFSAEAAVQFVLDETRSRMLLLKDDYIRERLQDVEDLSQRLLSHLTRQSEGVAKEQLPEEIILVARSLGPATLLDFGPNRLKGVVLEKGGYSNHVAIVARSLGIPMIGEAAGALSHIVAHDRVIVDGDRGAAYIRPSQYDIDLYAKSLEARHKRNRPLRRQPQDIAVTRDGVKVSVQANVGLLSEVVSLQNTGADGIGLFRTELSFMAWKKYPLVVTQAELYGKVLDYMGDRPVVFRTLDIGGDKPLPYFKAPAEENPALGWRAVRIGMDRPAVLRTQFRALIKGAKGRDIKIMLPLVTTVAEYDRARQLLELEKTRARERGAPVPARIELGVMLEVPALLFQLDTLLETVDFVSVGTNDLMQYLHAADRGSDPMRQRYDTLSPAMLRALKLVADQCRAAGVPVSICGEMAGNPLEAMVLIVLGYGILSVSPQTVEAVKMMISTLDTRDLLPYLEQLMKSRAQSLREHLSAFAKDHGITIAATT